MRFLHHLAVEFVRAETRIHVVVIGASVAMIRPSGFVVFQHRSRPDSGCTEFENMVERVDDTLDIATPAAVYIVLVGFFLGVLSGVIARVAIHKTVTHNQVDNICRSERLTFTTSFATLIDDVVIDRAFAVFLKQKTVVARLVDFHIHKQIIRRLGVMLTFHH